MAKEGKHAQDPQIMLALLCGATVEGAARQAGVSESTVRRRLKNPAFRRKLNKRRAELQLRLADQLLALGNTAIRTWAQLMEPTETGALRLGASRSVMEYQLKTRETADLAIRLTELEQRLAEQSDKKRRA
jgi:hypothetical protein